MEEQNYPALYQTANASSMAAQHRFLILVRSYSLLLIVSAGLGVYGIEDRWAAIVAAVVITFSIGLSIVMILQRDEDVWYRARAVAESVKTLTWRFMMGAEPYPITQHLQSMKVEFGRRLVKVLSEHRELSHELAGTLAQSDQITDAMCEIRSRSLSDRIAFYRHSRIDEQRTWYANKSSYNQKQGKLWFTLLLSCQGLAVILVILRVAFPGWRFLPTEVFLVAASAALTWIQVKKFRELAAAYGVTAHELGVIRCELDGISSEAQFAQFVSDSESAFSREHTQWLARKDAAL